jgi:hypothetical protein
MDLMLIRAASMSRAFGYCTGAVAATRAISRGHNKIHPPWIVSSSGAQTLGTMPTPGLGPYQEQTAPPVAWLDRRVDATPGHTLPLSTSDKVPATPRSTFSSLVRRAR